MAQSGPEWPKVAKSGPNGPNGQKWPSVAQMGHSGPNDPKWPRVAQVAQSGPEWPKWPKWPRVAQVALVKIALVLDGCSWVQLCLLVFLPTNSDLTCYFDPFWTGRR